MDRECTAGGMSGPWVYPWSKSGPHVVTTAIQTMLTQAGIWTMRNMYDVMTQLKEVQVGPRTQQMANKLQFGSPLSETCCKANPHHSQCCGRKRRDASSPSNQHALSNGTQRITFFKNLGFQFNDEHRIVDVSCQNWRMSIMGRGTVANSRVVLLSAGCEGITAAAYCDVLHENLGGTKEVSDC